MWGSVKNVMKLIKKVPSRVSAEQIIGRMMEGRAAADRYGSLPLKKAESAQSQSNISNINPLEDPYSEAGLDTP